MYSSTIGVHNIVWLSSCWVRIILVVSANIQAHKPTDKQRMTAFLNNYVVEQERKEVEKQERNASTPEPVSASALVPVPAPVANSCGTNKSDEC